MTRHRLAPSTLAITLFLAGCGSNAPGAGGGASTDPVAYLTGGDDLVLRVDVGGGLVPVDQTFATVPTFSLFGDGTIMLPGPQIEIYPPPALPPLVRRSVDAAGIQAILDRADRAGLLGPDRSFTTMLVTDAPTTTFTVVANGREHTTSVYALGITPGGPGVPAGEREARRALAAFHQELLDLPHWLPDGSLGPEEAAPIEAVRIFVGPDRSDPQVPQHPVRWPLSTPLDAIATTSVVAGYRCGVIGGADLEVLLPHLEAATTLTPWISEGTRYSLLPRPLLPDEAGC